MNSLDPRVARLPQIEKSVTPKVPLDQLGTFEVFVEPKEGKPFQHEGIVHAPDIELAYLLAKETFTRRFTCTSLFVTDTRQVFVSPLTDGDLNAYDALTKPEPQAGDKTPFEIFHLTKRGKQHIHVGSVVACSALDALHLAKEKFNTGKLVYNIWAIPSASIRFTTAEEKDLWLTLPEKKFRDAGDYKGGEKLKLFLENRK